MCSLMAAVSSFGQGGPPMMTDDPGVGRERSARDDVNQRSIDAMADLLAVALPEVERCLPDWKQVKAQAPGKDQVAAK